MLLEQVVGAVRHSSVAQLDALIRQFWADYSKGLYGDADAEAIQNAIEGRRKVLRDLAYKPSPTPLLDRLKRSANTKERIHRRRRVAQLGAMPAQISANFTVGEAACLTIIIGEIKRCGKCQMYVGQIAAAAGVCTRVCQRALRTAERLGLIQVTIRKRHMAPNLPNIVTVVCPILKAWIARSGALKGRVTFCSHNTYKNKNTPSHQEHFENANGSSNENATNRSHLFEPPLASGTIRYG